MKSADSGSPYCNQRRRLLLGMASVAALPLGVVSCAPVHDPNRLIIGGLPVTCNLTLPIACAGQALHLPAELGADDVAFQYARYSGWAEVTESMVAGRIQAAYLLAPQVMDLASQGIPLKIVSLGHRSGAVIMVRTDSGYENFRSLKGKRVAIPSRYAVDFLFLRKMLAEEGMDQNDILLTEMPPPDMPAALYAKAVDAYCTGEPFGSAAQRAGYARPLRLTRDEWPNYICCVLTVREELLQARPEVVQELVNYVQGAGHWLDEGPENREKAVAVASQRHFFNQDPGIIRFVMENPSDRVTYGDMRMLKDEFNELMELSIQAGTLRRPVDFETYAEESFYQRAKPAVIEI